MNSEKIVSSIDNFNTCIGELCRVADLYSQLTIDKYKEYEDLLRFSHFIFGEDHICSCVVEFDSLIVITYESWYDEWGYETYNIPLRVFDMTEDELKKSIEEYDRNETERRCRVTEENARQEAERKLKAEKEKEQIEYEEYVRLKEKFEKK